MGKKRKRRRSKNWFQRNWTYLGLGVVAVVAVTLVVLSLNRPVAPAAEANPQVTQVADDAPRPVVLFIGDSYTYGSPMGGSEYKGWPTALSTANEWTPAFYAQRGSGYVIPGDRGLTFGGQVDAAIAADVQPTIVIVEGGRNDRFEAANVPAAAAAAFASIREAWPEAKVLGIGPIWTDTEPGPEMFAIRDAVSTNTISIGGTFIDPLEARWFMDESARYLGTDNVHPTDEGHKYLGGLIQAALDGAGF